MQQFSLIICATPRSGSYYLLDLLSQSGLPYGEEWLTPYHISTRKRIYGTGEALDYGDYLKLLSRNERINGRFVLKVMFPQFNRLLKHLEKAKAGPADAFKELFPNPKFLYLEREDKLAQAISHLRARQTGRWVNLKENEEEDKIQPQYSFLGVQNELSELERMNIGWKRVFDALGMDVLRMQFESIRKNPQEAMNEVFSWLDMGVPKELQPVKQRFKPMGSGLNKDWRTRFEEDVTLSKEVTFPSPTRNLESLLIRDTTVSSPYVIGGNNVLEVSVVAKGHNEIRPIGAKDGSGWLRISGILEGEDTCEWFQQELRTAGGNALSAKCLLPDPAKPGVYSIKMLVSDRVMMPENIQADKTVNFSVEFQLPESRAGFRKLLPGIEDMPNGWQYVDWFGYFMDDKFPWIYHAEHEWLFIGKDNEIDQPLQILDANLGWIEIDPSTYPVIRSLEKNQQWKFLGRKDDRRSFRNVGSGETFHAETNRPEHLKNL